MHSFTSIFAAALLAGAAFAQDCVLTVPANPLTAVGLATPYTVTGCDQTQLATASFVECAIYDNAGTITLYHPLVVNAGSKAGVNFVPPVAATVPANGVVGCWFGTNGMTLTLAGPGAKACTNGLPGSIFGQFAYCNSPAFFKATQADAAAGVLKVPPPGQGSGGQCPTTQDFRMVDQDQSDNVVTSYLVTTTAGNKTMLMQNTPANAKNANATVLTNGSDNALLDAFLDPNLGCTAWKVNSITAPTGMSSGLALNELVGHFNPPTNPPVAAHVPLNDPMTLVNGNASLTKVNLYRAGVGQPPALTAADADPLAYCVNIMNAGLFTAQDMGLFQGKTSPAPGVAVDLYTFMAQRFAASINACNLGCLALLNLTQPVTLTMDGNCVVTAAVINVAPIQAVLAKFANINKGATTSVAAAKPTAIGTGATTMATVTKVNGGGAATSVVTVKSTVFQTSTATALSTVFQTSMSMVTNTVTVMKASAPATITQTVTSMVVNTITQTITSTIVNTVVHTTTITMAGSVPIATNPVVATNTVGAAGPVVTAPVASAPAAPAPVSPGTKSMVAPGNPGNPAAPATTAAAVSATASTTVVLSVPSSTVTLTTAVSAIATPATCTGASAAFTQDARGAIWDGQNWHVRVDFVGVEWINWAGPAPTAFAGF